MSLHAQPTTMITKMKTNLFLAQLFRRILLLGSVLSMINPLPAADSPSAIQDRPQYRQAVSDVLIWVGETAPAEAEEDALSEVVKLLRSGRQYLEVEKFIEDHPQSAWTPSLRARFAQACRSRGRYTLALKHWEAAWEATKNGSDANSKAVAELALAHWSQLLASLGRLE